MKNTAIKVQNLSKLYKIVHGNKIVRYKTLRETISKAVSLPLQLIGKTSDKMTTEYIWALRNLSFEVEHGEVVGIIGRNGAGKSTLLKIHSRITDPSEGTVDIYGRVGSLLEVGSGFHHELTGRENIYLNGAILGMKKNEIDNKFEEIVEFSGVQKFVDTPVKHYSSGMYLRLAFSVAAHLEPDILLVDEVLAVGDAEFQKKCIGKMSDVANAGRTVLFVSHQMAAIQNLCSRTILLDKGEIHRDDNTDSVVQEYMNLSFKSAQISLMDRKDRSGSGVIKFSKVKLKNKDGNVIDSFRSGDVAVFSLEYVREQKVRINNLHVAVGIDDSYGQRIAVLSNELTQEIFSNVTDSQGKIEIIINRLPLCPGRYGFTVFSKIDGNITDWIKNAGYFDVEAGDFFGTGKVPQSKQGNFLIEHSFRLIGESK